MKYLYDYDKTIKVGDIVTGYYKGYWRVVEVRKRKEYAPIIVGELVLDSNGNKAKKKRNEWDSSYSKKITLCEVKKIIDYDLEYFTNKKKNLLNLVVPPIPFG